MPKLYIKSLQIQWFSALPTYLTFQHFSSKPFNRRKSDRWRRVNIVTATLGSTGSASFPIIHDCPVRPSKTIYYYKTIDQQYRSSSSTKEWKRSVIVAYISHIRSLTISQSRKISPGLYQPTMCPPYCVLPASPTSRRQRPCPAGAGCSSPAFQNVSSHAWQEKNELELYSETDSPDVDQDGFCWDVTIREDHHHIRVGREDVNEGGEVWVPHFHGLEVSRQFAAAEFELLDDVGNLLEPVHVSVLVPLGVGYHCR